MRFNLDTYEIEPYGHPQTPIFPKVSVCLITFNHVRFIKMCLESILSQKTEFPFEIIIGDDCSTDGTSDIISEYADKYPHQIKAFIHPQNLSKYGSPGKLNYLHTYYASRGEYVVHVEGDDYLTDNLKLQKQIDFLDTHLNYSACFHNTLMKFEDNSGRKDYLINSSKDQKREITTLDLLAEQEVWFMATASVMYRKSIIGDRYPDWFSESKSGDIPLYVLLSHYAPIAYIDEVMSTYRRHESGLSYTDDKENLLFLTNRIEMYENIHRHTNKKYKMNINKILNYYFDLVFATNDLQVSQKLRIKYFIKALPYQNFFKRNTYKKLFERALTQNYKRKLFHK